MLISAATERWPSGRRRTPGKCVYGNVSRVRIPPSPPKSKKGLLGPFFRLSGIGGLVRSQVRRNAITAAFSPERSDLLGNRSFSGASSTRFKTTQCPPETYKAMEKVTDKVLSSADYGPFKSSDTGTLYRTRSRVRSDSLLVAYSVASM